MTFQVRLREDGLAVSGELSIDGADDFREFAASRVDGSRMVVLDITELTFIDSVGIRAITRLAESACPRGLLLLWPRRNVQRVLDLVRIEDIAGIRVERRPSESPGGSLP